MCSDRDTRALPRVGFPIRKSAGQRLFSTSPRLIAAIHVLHRLLTPRHPPYALRILMYRAHTHHYAVFKVRLRASSRGVPSTQQHDRPSPLIPHAHTNPWHVGHWSVKRSTLRPGRRRSSQAVLSPMRESIGSPSPPERGGPWMDSILPRKEVIQPQLPLRLPCYDFTPIADPTFDSCLPCGLAHRLRVLPTFVV